MTVPTVTACLAEGAETLDRAGVETARREARLLLAYALDRPLAWLIANPEAAVSKAAEFHAMIRRRAGREPTSHILGQREFWSLSFEIGPAALDPRPDSETIVEAALANLPDGARHMLDLGVGCGCLLLAVLSERPELFGVGVDLSLEAVELAERNAGRLGLRGRAAFMVADWASALDSRFDLIVANPPYIVDSEIDRLEPEVARFDPRLALDGGADGLAAYHALSPELGRLLKPGGIAVLEFGADQKESVAAILDTAGLKVDAVRTDLAGRPRCLLCRSRAAGKKTLGMSVGRG